MDTAPGAAVGAGVTELDRGTKDVPCRFVSVRVGVDGVVLRFVSVRAGLSFVSFGFVSCVSGCTLVFNVCGSLAYSLRCLAPQLLKRTPLVRET